MNKITITDLTLKELEFESKNLGIEPYRISQILKWIYKKYIFDFEKMTDLPKDKIKILNEKFKILETKLVDTKISKDGTAKFLIKLPADQYCVESVLLNDKKRFTICLSTQIGCALGCKFCLSGKFSFKRNLTVSEIIGQILIVNSYLKNTAQNINNIVFMGMGEPLLNFDNVIKAIDIITSPYSFNIGSRKITISSSGIIPGIEKLSREKKQVRLSISLHSPFQKIREDLMPITKKYHLDKLLSAAKNYVEKTDRELTFEYILIEGINDSEKDINELAKIIKNIKCTVNLIPYNYTGIGKYKSPNLTRQQIFHKKLEELGVKATLRKKRGSDIEAACGQLSLKTL